MHDNPWGRGGRGVGVVKKESKAKARSQKAAKKAKAV
jgi:hypothetical protein